MGDFADTGEIKLTYQVIALEITELTLSATTLTYNGRAQSVSIASVKSGEKTLEAGQYTIKDDGRTGTDTGTYTVKVEGIEAQGYKGTASATWTINPAKITAVKLSAGSFKYDGRAKSVNVTGVVVEGGATFNNAADFTVSGQTSATKQGTYRVNVTGRRNLTGTASNTWSITGVASNVMYRLYNPNSGEHFYTANRGERDATVAAGWNYEGHGWNAPVTSNTPVYRLYNANVGDHHYTPSKNERDTLLKIGWKDEGIGWYSDDAKGVPLYRQYNPNAVTGTHNYTTSKSENDTLASLGWKPEGIGWYGVK